MDVQVSALHRLPFDAERFESEMESVADHSAEMREELEGQYRENWENAWIVVIEYDNGTELDFSLFGYPDNSPDGQAVWLEQELEPEENRARAAFFLHYVDPKKLLAYGKRRLPFPSPTEAPKWLVERLNYASPD